MSLVLSEPNVVSGLVRKKRPAMVSQPVSVLSTASRASRNFAMSSMYGSPSATGPCLQAATEIVRTIAAIHRATGQLLADQAPLRTTQVVMHL